MVEATGILGFFYVLIWFGFWGFFVKESVLADGLSKKCLGPQRMSPNVHR